MIWQDEELFFSLDFLGTFFPSGVSSHQERWRKRDGKEVDGKVCLPLEKTLHFLLQKNCTFGLADRIKKLLRVASKGIELEAPMDIEVDELEEERNMLNALIEGFCCFVFVTFSQYVAHCTSSGVRRF